MSGRFAPMALFMTDNLSFRSRRVSLTSLVACLLATSALAAPAFGQELPQPIPAQASTAVQSIVVHGNERIEESTVLAYLPITIGQQAQSAFAHQWRLTATPLPPIIRAKAQCMLGTAA